ncbi:DUF983 domain-containing protein [Pseudobacteriovorax antillogorgiicola]|uniref:DUF983 domain-containing protein n=1 Tax=Pseudobacteriovorax antillogorgiicola TaxID=1513793 RepID=A0A1Y6BMV0_9BACT|nr:DUF983 domain-containing protein [Pseudobacteriovorax antillogorgiicola]TCS53930.1 uncharacterized protein DUF983 [Pseudobacteriovorax antillogorgiicola]SMF20451.1 Protein of unknown function [Pseudobacteriovorax antillogorgiicola]
MDLGKPKLRAIALLRCPYCLETPLRKPKSWFEFRDGCSKCGYRFEREPGYFLGSPWMINYPITSLVCFALTYYLFQYQEDMAVLIKAAVVALAGIATGLILYPFSRAIWLVGDHFLHPLGDEDFKQKPQAD